MKKGARLAWMMICALALTGCGMPDNTEEEQTEENVTAESIMDEDGTERGIGAAAEDGRDTADRRSGSSCRGPLHISPDENKLHDEGEQEADVGPAPFRESHTYLPVILGKRQTLPDPMARLAGIRMKPGRDEKFSLFSMACSDSFSYLLGNPAHGRRPAGKRRAWQPSVGASSSSL